MPPVVCYIWIMLPYARLCTSFTIYGDSGPGGEGHGIISWVWRSDAGFVAYRSCWHISNFSPTGLYNWGYLRLLPWICNSCIDLLGTQSCASHTHLLTVSRSFQFTVFLQWVSNAICVCMSKIIILPVALPSFPCIKTVFIPPFFLISLLTHSSWWLTPPPRVM